MGLVGLCRLLLCVFVFLWARLINCILVDSTKLRIKLWKLTTTEASVSIFTSFVYHLLFIIRSLSILSKKETFLHSSFLTTVLFASIER